jgi:hypothetical protein
VLDPAVFATLQSHFGKLFDWSSTGSVTDLLSSDLAGRHGYAVLPYRHALSIVSHYLECKSKQPHDTGACFVVPATHQRVAAQLRAAGMQLVHEWSRGTPMFFVHATAHAPMQPSACQRHAGMD